MMHRVRTIGAAAAVGDPDMKILLAIDGSACSDAAVREVARRPWPAGTEVRLLTVDPPLDAGLLPEGATGIFDEIVQRQRAAAGRRLHQAAAVLQGQAPALLVKPTMKFGWPKEVILDEADQWGAELIVVGSNGYGVLRRFLLGSVSLALATHAPCSVEIVRAPRASPPDPAPVP